MALLSSKKAKSLVGLDIETGSIAATEVRVNGSTEVIGGGVMPLGSGVFREGEVADPDALGQAIKELFARERLPREVRVGIANQRVAVRSMRLPPSTTGMSSKPRSASRRRITSRCLSIRRSSTGR